VNHHNGQAAFVIAPFNVILIGWFRISTLLQALLIIRTYVGRFNLECFLDFTSLSRFLSLVMYCKCCPSLINGQRREGWHCQDFEKRRRSIFIGNASQARAAHFRWLCPYYYVKCILGKKKTTTIIVCLPYALILSANITPFAILGRC
jgi:hypothetical protein